MLPIAEWDWPGLWSHFFLPTLLLLGAYALVVAVMTAYKMLSPSAKRKRAQREALMTRYGWDGKP